VLHASKAFLAAPCEKGFQRSKLSLFKLLMRVLALLVAACTVCASQAFVPSSSFSSVGSALQIPRTCASTDGSEPDPNRELNPYELRGKYEPKAAELNPFQLRERAKTKAMLAEIEGTKVSCRVTNVSNALNALLSNNGNTLTYHASSTL
jgi:hypothetical protein